MRTAHFSAILRRTAALMGVVIDEISTDDFAKLQSFFTNRLAVVWHQERWPELVKVEQRLFRDLYAVGTTYGAGAEVYYPATQKYYISLKATNLGHAPDATASAWWAESATAYSFDTWVTATAYVVGDQRYYELTDAYYQCHTPHVSSSVLTPDATGVNAKWGLMTPFQRYVSLDQTGRTPIGLCLGVYRTDPRLGPATELPWVETEDGVQVRYAITRVWVEFMAQVPDLTASVYDSASVYVALDSVYFVDADGIGDFYVANSSCAATESPSAKPLQWDVVEIPERFTGYLALAVYANWLTADGQADKAGGYEQLAAIELESQLDQVHRLQGQTRRIRWST